MDMQKEIWKDIPWYEWLYQASNLGRIKSLSKKWSWWHNWKILKATLKFYLEICIIYENNKE